MKRFAFALTLLACASPAFAGQGQNWDCFQHGSGRPDWQIGQFSDQNSCERYAQQQHNRGVNCYCRIDVNPGGPRRGQQDFHR